MRGRILTPHLRQRLTPDERRKLRRALQVMPEEDPSPSCWIAGCVCHGERSHPWAVGLGMRLGDFVCRQLSCQEGFRVDFKAAILCIESSRTLIWWGSPGEVVAMPWDLDVAGSPFMVSSRPHPPILELPGSERYPMDVPYRVSAGILAGRSGYLRVSGRKTIRDEVLVMS